MGIFNILAVICCSDQFHWPSRRLRTALYFHRVSHYIPSDVFLYFVNAVIVFLPHPHRQGYSYVNIVNLDPTESSDGVPFIAWQQSLLTVSLEVVLVLAHYYWHMEYVTWHCWHSPGPASIIVISIYGGGQSIVPVKYLCTYVRPEGLRPHQKGARVPRERTETELSHRTRRNSSWCHENVGRNGDHLPGHGH